MTLINSNAFLTVLYYNWKKIIIKILILIKTTGFLKKISCIKIVLFKSLRNCKRRIKESFTFETNSNR